MKVAEFLNTISTPKVENNSYTHILLKKLNKSVHGAFRQKNLNIQTINQTLLQKSSSVHLSHMSLDTTAPFYTNKRNQPHRKLNFSCHQKKNPIDSTNFKHSHFFKKGQKSESTWQIRKQIGKQKRYFLRNYQRFTYQPPRTQEKNQNSIRIQQAEAKIVHKFCNLFSIKCAGCKCKLDCINQKFQQFLKSKNLCILQGLNQIVGRGINLDNQIKAQIMDCYMNRDKTKNIQDFMQKISNLIKKKLTKNATKKYLNWAKSMYGIIEKIEKHSNRIKEVRKRSCEKQIIFNSSFEKASFIYNSNINPIKKKKKKNQDQRFIKTVDFVQMVKKKKNRKVHNHQILSILGSQKEVTFKQKTLKSLNKSEENQQDQNASYFQSKFKAKLKKYNSISQSNSRKRLQALTPLSTKILEIQKTNSAFYSQLNEKDQKDQDLQQQQNYSNQRQQKNHNTSQQSIIQENSQNQGKNRLNLFQNMLNNLNKQKKYDENISDLKNIAKQPRYKNINNNKNKDKEESQNNQTNLNKKKFHKIRTSYLNDHKNKSVRIQIVSILQNSNQTSVKQETKRIAQKKNQQSETLIKSKKRLKKKQQTIIKVQQDIGRQSVFNCQNSKHSFLKLTNEQANTNLVQIYNNINKNATLIKKIQQQLTEAGLQCSIINQTDTLFTQKRKITYMKQNISQGLLKNRQEDFQQYFNLIMNKKQINNLENFLQKTLQNKNKTGQKQNFVGEEQLELLLQKYRALKFYNLRHKGMEDLREAAKQRQCSEVVQLELKQKKNQQPALNRQFLGKIENYVTQKERTPFDYFHYLQLGDNLAIKKFSNERNISNFQDLIHEPQNFLQKNAQNVKFHSNNHFIQN